MGFFDDAVSWGSQGECSNKSDKDVTVCVTPKGEARPHLEVLKPGEKTNSRDDCEGYIQSDGNARKVHGKTGWTSMKDEAFIRAHWAECAQLIRDTNDHVAGVSFNDTQNNELSYMVHCEKLGDSGKVGGCWFVGTRGQHLRLEGLQVWSTSQEWDLEYMAHLEGRGDVPWQPSGSFIGSRGERRRLEGLAFRLTKGVGSFDVLYKAHIAGIGDSSWLKNGEFIGTRGQRRAIEAIEIAVVPVGAVTTSGQSFSLDQLGGSIADSAPFGGVKLTPL
jgi:hypothetical protein